jgi:enoyl-CoA hydratase/carnithine racemase/citrate lyase beta subunit
MARDYEILRSWLFVPAADASAIEAAAISGTDVAIAEFEDFTPPDQRPAARTLLADALAGWRAAGIVTAVRINPLWTADGPADLAAAMSADADIIAFPKVRGPEDVRELDAALSAAGSAADLLPNIESAAALVATGEIARASDRVRACLVASEDMAADLGAERSRDGAELRYVRERFLVECRAAHVTPVDCPYTWSDLAGLEAETHTARQLGYTAKSAVDPYHPTIINHLMTPDRDAVAHAEKIVAAFEAARAAGLDRAHLDGHMVELPTYLGAQRLLTRAEIRRPRGTMTAIDTDSATSIDTGTEQLLAELNDGVLTITFNRPEARNALSDVLTPALRKMLAKIPVMDEVGALVLTGSGTAFCAGGDVKGMKGGYQKERTFDEAVEDLHQRQITVSAALYGLRIPTIAALPGPAAGAGLSIALACDMRIAAESTFVATGYVRVGLSGDYGINWLLPRVVGPSRARQLMFTGEKVDAATGERYGLFNQVVPDDKLQETAFDLARTLANGPRTALANMKDNLDQGMEQDLESFLGSEAHRLVSSARTEDHKEAVRAFVEKRAPKFGQKT